MSTTRLPAMPPLTSRHVAGAGGLVAARELSREGHTVVVFKKQNQVGGTWVYSPNTESDPIGLDPNRNIVHTSLYASLRTNLPREVMGFRDFPFVETGRVHRDPRRFPGHEEVLGEVASKKGGGDQVDEVYDAVVVCNGHYTEPRIADIPVLIGSSTSGVDISKAIAGVAREVHIAARSNMDGFNGIPGYKNMWRHSMIVSAHEDGNIVFQDGNAVCADIILHCTGYKYHFPFLDTNGNVTVDDNRVGPLCKHIFPPSLAPWLSFVGLPWKVVPFPLLEFQGKWIAGILSGRISLPSREEMMKDVNAFYSSLEASGVPKRYTHNMSDYQFAYNDWLANELGCSPSEEWRKQMFSATSKNRAARPETYHDEWEDTHLVSEAHEDFIKYTCKRPS
ncbi:hypothetical protein RJ639_026871 [Escallonia herrerae]|uniref:Flavin-containing monooxygenase n=1 Tax=Escallonia herrerae TaxID=1293975 RepID=A0AA88XAH6_9ASTE|nr:hypothetical protein RJ639_026871 [Escallonia herrerae]